MKSNKQVTEILLFGLKERYDSIHRIRERVQNIGLWSLGLLISAIVWLMINNYIFVGFQKTLIMVSVGLGYYYLRHIYLEDLKVGFCNQQKIAARIEKILGYYTPQLINGSKTTIYPVSWEKAGTDDGGGNYFKSTYLMLKFATALLLLIVLLNGLFCF